MTLTIRQLLGCGAALAALGWSGTGQAQTIENSFTDSYTESLVFNPATVTTTNVTIYSTQILGRLNGGTPLYDQTFGVPFSDPIAQAGVVAARAAITTAGGPGVIIGAPVLTASSSNIVSSSVTTYSLAGPPVALAPNTVVTFGPADIRIGTLSSCAAGSLPSTARPSCTNTGGVAYRVGDDETNFNTIHNTQYTIGETTATTNTTTIFEQYTIDGIIRRIGSVHALAADAGGEAAGLFTQRLRLAGDGELRRGFWLTGYGFFGQRGAQGEIAADRRSGEGVTGGFAGRFGDGFSAGVGFDAGRTRLRLPVVGESGTVALVQAGVHVGLDRGPFSLRLSGAYGRGHIETATAPADFAFTTGARYGLRTASLSGEAGYAIPLGGWRLTPALGGEWRHAHTEGFAEPGAYGLSAEANGTGQARGWAGLTLDRSIGAGGGLRFYARATMQGHDRVVLPVGFTLLGGSMQLESPDYGTFGAEAGASALLPLTPGAYLYAAYDARIRGGLALHMATGGVRFLF
ncbi:MAG: autotransporter outer membrane beta-barrel domain-containing protein [Novosphingobium sp.]